LASQKIGVLAAAFNPITRAHLALVDAGLRVVDRVLCVVPRAYPHKEFEGAAFDERIEMLRRVQAGYEIVVTEGGLFLEIARELRATHSGSEIHFLCGRDAAHRVLEWDYGEPGMPERMLQEFGLLVASRQGEFHPPDHLKNRVSRLALEGDYDEVSSSEVRRRIAAGEPWEHLVPEAVVEMARRIYGR
jgi:nicotinic acid mononucleotide adenylyltransferase